MPEISEFAKILGQITVSNVPVPHDCADGFLGAYWRRPRAYLDPEIRAAISTFSKLGDISSALTKLDEDLNSGVWGARYGRLLDVDELDMGYRVVIADCKSVVGIAG